MVFCTDRLSRQDAHTKVFAGEEHGADIIESLQGVIRASASGSLI